MDDQTVTGDPGSQNGQTIRRGTMRRRSAIRYEPGSRLAEADAYFLMRLLGQVEAEKDRERLVSIAERILVSFGH